MSTPQVCEDDGFDMNALLKELSDKSEGSYGFVEKMWEELERCASPEGDYDECFEAYRSEKRKLYEEYAKDDATTGESAIHDLTSFSQIIDPEADPEVALPKFTELPKNFHDYVYSKEMPSSEEFRTYRETSLAHFQQIADWELEKLEKVYGEKAKKSMFHPNNRKNAPYWNYPF